MLLVVAGQTDDYQAATIANEIMKLQSWPLLRPLSHLFVEGLAMIEGFDVRNAEDLPEAASSNRTTQA